MHRNSLIITCIAVFVFLGFLAASENALAATSCAPGLYQVGGQNVYGRAGASTEARIVVSVPSGTSVQVIGERLGSVVGGNGAWCETVIDG